MIVLDEALFRIANATTTAYHWTKPKEDSNGERVTFGDRLRSSPILSHGAYTTRTIRNIEHQAAASWRVATRQVGK